MDASVSQALIELASKALDHGIESIKATENDLTPFVMIESSKGTDLLRFVADRLELATTKAMEHVQRFKNDSTVQRYALTYSGYTTLEGVKYESIIVRAGEKGNINGYAVAQPFKWARKGFHKNLETVGSPISQTVTGNLLMDQDLPPFPEMHPEFLFKNTFSEFGIVINFPDLELDKKNYNGKQSDNKSGKISGHFKGSDDYNHIFIFSWTLTLNRMPQSFFDEYFSGWTRSNVNRDPIKTIVVNNINVNYQTFTSLLRNGITTYNVCSVWSLCNKDFTLQILGGRSPESIVRIFNIYLSSFSYKKTI